METDMTQMMIMMQDMHSSMQDMHSSMQEMRSSMQEMGSSMQEIRSSMQGLGKRFDGLAIEFIRSENRMKTKFEDFTEEMKGIYRHTAAAAEDARSSANKVYSHGSQLVDHEDRIRSLEGKRKSPPAV